MQRIVNYFNNLSNSLKVWINEAFDTLQKSDIFVASVIILVAFGSFGLGRLSKIEESREPITIEDISDNGGAVIVKNTQETTSGSANLPAVSYATQAGKNYVASKNGAKYFLTWCSGAGRISEANKVYFTTKEEATAAGFTPAANCPGI